MARIQTIGAGKINVLKSCLHLCGEKYKLNFNEDKRYLIRGASGHFGIWATLVLAQAFKTNNASHFYVLTSQFQYLYDVLKALALDKYVLEYQKNEVFDFVFDYSLPSQSGFEPDLKFASEALSGFYAGLQMTAEGGTYINPSSGAVYGELKFRNFPKDEMHTSQVESRSTYGDTKFFLENLSRKIDDKRVPSFRVFTVFGPLFRAESELFTNTLFKTISLNSAISLKSAGTNIRNFTFVGEIVSQLFALSQNKYVDSSSVINLGNELTQSMKEFAMAVASYSNKTLIIQSNEENPDYYFPSVRKLQQLLDISDVDLTDDFIRLTTEYYA